MRLEKTRLALDDAERALGSLRDYRNDTTNENRWRFRATVTLMSSVGAVLKHEASSRGDLSKLGNWWAATKKDPRYEFLWDQVRNPELKERANTRENDTTIALTNAVGARDSGGYELKRESGDIQTGSLETKGASGASRSVPPAVATVTWRFPDGRDVFDVLDEYLAWLRDEIIPEAERLLGP